MDWWLFRYRLMCLFAIFVKRIKNYIFFFMKFTAFVRFKKWMPKRLSIHYSTWKKYSLITYLLKPTRVFAIRYLKKRKFKTETEVSKLFCQNCIINLSYWVSNTVSQDNVFFFLNLRFEELCLPSFYTFYYI